MIDPETQIQSAGVEFTLNYIDNYVNHGTLAFDNSERKLPTLDRLHPDEDGWFALPHGSYLVTLRETVSLPSTLCAIARPRSSLLRMGVTINTALFDPGYTGKSQVMMTVNNKNGFMVKKGARLIQLVFFEMNNEVEKGYSGIYQRENL